MEYQVRIDYPKSWKENYLKKKLLERGISQDRFVEEFNSNVKIIVTNRLSITELNNLIYLKKVIVPTSGVENICLDKLSKKGIEIIYNPWITAKGVANYTHKYLMKFLKSHNLSPEKKKVCLLGTGVVAFSIYEKIKRDFRDFVSFGKNKKTNLPIKKVIEEKGLIELLKSSDIIINTLPKNPETYRLLFDKTSLFKKGSLIINVSRFGILNEREIIKRVDEGALSGLISDVNPRPSKYKKIHGGKTILTPHIAGIFGDSLENLALFVKKNLICSGIKL